MNTDHNRELIDYDKRYGVPSFEGWEEREVESHLSKIKKARKRAKFLWLRKLFKNLRNL